MYLVSVLKGHTAGKHAELPQPRTACADRLVTHRYGRACAPTRADTCQIWQQNIITNLWVAGLQEGSLSGALPPHHLNKPKELWARAHAYMHAQVVTSESTQPHGCMQYTTHYLLSGANRGVRGY